jgi:hypothetical protein
MRTSTLILLSGLALAAPLALAQEEVDHSTHAGPAAEEAAPAPEEQGGGHDHGTAKPSPARENMQKTEGLMAQIAQSADPAEKRELLRAHLQALREQMKLLRSERAGMKMAAKSDGNKDAGGMMGGMMKDGGMMKGGGMMGMHKKMVDRVDMLERVLQQLIEHEAVEAELEGR